VRRRVLASPPNDAPFTKCAKDARALTGSEAIEHAHVEVAGSFIEYGVRSGAGPRLDELRVTVAPLAALARDAWPFVRSGITTLMKPSLGAREAVHPVAPARPGLGRGIPAHRTHYRSIAKSTDGLTLAFGKGAHLSAHRSNDGGVNWSRVSPRSSLVEAIAGRCPAGEGKSFEIAVSDDGNFFTVRSVAGDEAPRVADLVPESDTLLTVACDERALVALVKAENKPSAALYLCPFASRCRAIAAPALGSVNLSDDNVDLARVHGATVLSLTTGGIVRVASSRDDGRTWTPFAVAFDAAEYPDVKADVRVPGRLLAVGGRVFLYGGATKSAQSYSLLMSDDQGASFRTPG
jgi:hypothetical protein